MSNSDHFKFRLYVAGDAPNSLRAVANLVAICREHLPERYNIEVIDVLQNQQKALADGVMMTPLLIKLSPLPTRKITGSLSQREGVLQTLGLPSGT